MMNPLWPAPEKLTHTDWAAAHEGCLAAMRSGAIGIDWAACQQIDSSALALAIAAQRVSKLDLRHENAPAQLRALAALHGVDALLGLAVAA